jgi:glucuronoarabinoxylan endo-1,4-beta-xylanase
VSALRQQVCAVARQVARIVVAAALGLAAVLGLGACGGPSGVSLGGAGGATGGQAGSGVGGGGPIDVTVTVDVTERHQTLVGFGGAVAFYTNFLAPRTDDIFKALFVDLGIDILRVANWYQNQSASGTTLDTGFTDADTVAIVQKATAAMGHPPKILMSSWSPPAYLKSNGVTKGTRGTLLRAAGTYDYAQFADWWVRSIAAYTAQGVVPDYISLQNEPDFFNAGWETCQLDTAEDATNAGYGRALDAVSAEIAGSTLDPKPKIIGPENSGANNGVQRYLNNMSAASFDVVAHHLYNGGMAGNDPAPDSFATSMTNVANAAANAGGKPIFMTEFAPQAPSLFNTAWMIQDALTTEGVSAYIYWGLIWAPPAAGAAPAGLVTITGAAPSSPYTINDTYYAMKHFARWTDPDWVRVGAASSAAEVRSSAFLSPDGASLTVVLLNTDTADHVVSVGIGAAFATTTVYRTSGTDERVTPVPYGADSIPLPAKSIATLVLTR